MNDRRGSGIFVWVVAISVALKLWLTSPITINAQLAPHDYTNFLEHAKAVLGGGWFGPYDNLTLIKGPGMPLYLAGLHEIGISITLAHQLIYSAACLCACIAIRPLARNERFLAVTFVVLLFNPVSFSERAWSLNRSQLMDTLTLFMLSTGTGAALRSRRSPRKIVPWLVGVGFSASALWLTREDTLWIAAPLCAFLAMYLWNIVTDALPAKALRASLAAIPMAVFAGCIGIIMSINGANYGWKTTVETTSPQFVSAYQSLTRIVLPHFDNRAYPAPEAARREAYRVSLAAAELRPYFDSTGKWKAVSCSELSLCEDVSAGWFLWAFRDAVAGAGYYASGAKAHDYYIRLSGELDAACADGRLHCRAKSYSLSPPIYPSDVPAIVGYAWEAFWHTAKYDQIELGGLAPRSASDESVYDDYAAVTGSGAGTSRTYTGWLLRDKRSTVMLDDPVATDLRRIEFEPSPDVRSAYASSAEFKGDDLDYARFSVTTSCEHDCFLDVTLGRRMVRVPLSGDDVDFRAPGIAYHLDIAAQNPPPVADVEMKQDILAQILLAYRQIIHWWLVVVVLALIVRLYRFVRGRRPRSALLFLGMMGCYAIALAAHCGLLGVVSAVSFYALYAEYQVALFPMLLLIIGAQASIEGEIFLRLVRRALPAPRSSLPSPAQSR